MIAGHVMLFIFVFVMAYGSSFTGGRKISPENLPKNNLFHIFDKEI